MKLIKDLCRDAEPKKLPNGSLLFRREKYINAAHLSRKSATLLHCTVCNGGRW